MFATIINREYRCNITKHCLISYNFKKMLSSHILQANVANVRLVRINKIFILSKMIFVKLFSALQNNVFVINLIISCSKAWYWWNTETTDFSIAFLHGIQFAAWYAEFQVIQIPKREREMDSFAISLFSRYSGFVQIKPRSSYY